jgi:O-antigen ligase
MPREIAFLVCILLVWWLLGRDRALRGRFSPGLWVPTLWVGIIGSRPISTWFGYEVGTEAVDLEGSPVDRLIFLVLILAAFAILWRRKVNWSAVIARNRWLCAYFAFLGISVVWADLPFVSFKRWVKDIGNILMVLVIFSEADPIGAAKSVLFRCACCLVPFSVLVIKYYPEVGRYFDQWTWQYHYGGVTTDKNVLGMTLFLCGIGLCWSFLDLWDRSGKERKDLFAHGLLMVMCLWLWSKANSATSLSCTVIGAGILVAMRLPALRNPIPRIGLWGLLVLFLLALGFNALFNPMEIVAAGLGRDLTLTGRTDIWQQTLRMDINPLIGTGYCSFWQGDRAKSVSESIGYFFALKEAHNGYLDVYLNSGLIGLALLAGVLISNANRIIKGLASGGSFAAFRFSVLAAAIIYNMTESAFCGLVMLWVVLLLAIIEYPDSDAVAADDQLDSLEDAFRASRVGQDFSVPTRRSGLEAISA